MDIDAYEREGRAHYAAFAATVAAILTAATRAEPALRLQQVADRAKQPGSLRRKLANRGIADTTTLADDIKDLAGCRIIFYTNSDVSRFINSGIIDGNFEVLETKLHHPGQQVEDAAQLYISNHYLVRLKPERAALPEYARFAGLRCEVQVQTILNHTWAEMAHDTIYKTPDLENFGGKAFDGIKQRLAKVARKYLLPAGYEFQKIAGDFQRLLDGKDLFDGGALDAIVAAQDNNTRADALETFAENVVPFYDDLPAEYPAIAERLVEAVTTARATAPKTIETPYGELPAKTAGDIVRGVAELLGRYRYLGVDATFDALRALYAGVQDDEERTALTTLAESLAKHNVHVWRNQGPIVQAILVDRIEALPKEERAPLRTLITTLLGEIVKAEVTGTTNSSNAVTFHQGAVAASDALRDIRARAIVLLKAQIDLAETDDDRRTILHALEGAARTPYTAGYSNALARLIFDNTREIIAFETEIAPTLGFELLQSIEDGVRRTYINHRTLPETMASDPELVSARDQLLAAALAFRDAINADRDFVTYKGSVPAQGEMTP